MALQTSGTISINDLRNEFGDTPGDDGLSEYYRGGSYVPDISANNNVPTSGQISLSNFYGATFGYPIRITISAGGGGGGGGFNDGGPNNGVYGAGTSGQDSWVRDSNGFDIARVTGGGGGGSGNVSGTTGGAGQNSPINANGAGGGGSANNSGGSSTRTSWGASGGGGGGDASSKNDPAGNAGAGGSRGGSASGTYASPTANVSVRVGGGGAGYTSLPQNGGSGSPGYVRIRDGFDGDKTFTTASGRGGSDHNYRVA